MIIADTSIWIHHFRKANAQFCQLLTEGQIAMHPFILGELSCGNLPSRISTIRDLSALPMAAACLDREVRELIESRQLMGRGIGYIDAHLLASALISGFPLWTRDKRLQETAAMLGCSYT